MSSTSHPSHVKHRPAALVLAALLSSAGVAHAQSLPGATDTVPPRSAADRPIGGSSHGPSSMTGMGSGSGSGSNGSGWRSTFGNAYASDGGQGASWLPWTRSGYVGINIGKPNYGVGCGLTGSCDDPSGRVAVYTGGLFNEVVGMEIGYVYEGAMRRGGGKTRAEGVNASFVVRVPVQQFNLFAKGGAIYGRARVSADPLSGVVAGRDRDWGVSWGAGLGYDFTRNAGVVLEWSRNEFKFPGSGKRDVDSTSLGYVHRF